MPEGSVLQCSLGPRRVKPFHQTRYARHDTTRLRQDDVIRSACNAASLIRFACNAISLPLCSPHAGALPSPSVHCYASAPPPPFVPPRRPAAFGSDTRRCTLLLLQAAMDRCLPASAPHLLQCHTAALLLLASVFRSRRPATLFFGRFPFPHDSRTMPPIACNAITPRNTRRSATHV